MKEKFKLGKPDEPCIVCGRHDSIWHHIWTRNKAPHLINEKINLMPLCPWHHTPSKVSIHHLGLTEFVRVNRLEYYMKNKGWHYDEHFDKWYLPNN